MKHIYSLVNCERLHLHYFFDAKKFKLTKRKKTSERAEVQGWVKKFLGKRFLILLYDAEEVNRQTVFIGKHRFQFEDIEIERKRFLCFYLYKIKNARRNFYYWDSNGFDYIYKKMDATWDLIDEDHYDIFYKDFKRLKNIE